VSPLEAAGLHVAIALSGFGWVRVAAARAVPTRPPRQPGGVQAQRAAATRCTREFPRGVVSRELRDAQRAGLVDSAITLSNEPSRDRVFWLTADNGLRVLLELATDRGG
jgi:hypothetical protein